MGLYFDSFDGMRKIRLAGSVFPLFINIESLTYQAFRIQGERNEQHFSVLEFDWSTFGG